MAKRKTKALKKLQGSMVWRLEYFCLDICMLGVWGEVGGVTIGGVLFEG